MRLHTVWFIALFQVCGCKKNILFLVADDMRPELTSFLGPDFPSQVHPKIHSPNLDALAAKSLLLKRAYVQQAVCSPSRTSVLTGRRPDTTHVYNLETYFRNSGGNFTTIPQFFKQNGYLSVGMGKIFHPGVLASDNDDPVSWSEPYFHPVVIYNPSRNSWMAVPESQLVKHRLVDQLLADHALSVLDRVAPKARTAEQPVFLAIGFHKPHLPFIFPEEFLSYYPEESIHLPDNQYAPWDMPDIAWSDYSELRDYADIAQLHARGGINSTLPAKLVHDLRRAYYSSVSYTDSLIGKVLSKIEEVGMANNTIVSFWGDHGWQLGEHGEWCKHTNFELATHAPMMIHIPGITDHGIITEQLTEFVDLFPTLVEASGFAPLPLCPEDSSSVVLCREGNSLMPLTKNPSRQDWKQAAFSQYPRDDYIMGYIMGYTMRTDRYRYTEWVIFEGEPKYKPMWEKVTGAELYDHKVDPNENRNKAYNAAYHTVRLELSKKLHLGWRNGMGS